jgi:hypothetical protein
MSRHYLVSYTVNKYLGFGAFVEAHVETVPFQ